MGFIDIIVLLLVIVGAACIYICLAVLSKDGDELLWEVMERATEGAAWPYRVVKALAVRAYRASSTLVSFLKKGRDNA